VYQIALNSFPTLLGVAGSAALKLDFESSYTHLVNYLGSLPRSDATGCVLLLGRAQGPCIFVGSKHER
jgi:hypothetical protein